MPIYEYQREDGTVFEHNQSINDDPLETCPETGQKVKKLISKNAFHLKGGGWYKTDYSSGSPSTASSADSKTSDDSSSDSKPADSSSSKKDSSDKGGGSEGGSSGGCGSSCGCH